MIKEVLNKSTSIFTSFNSYFLSTFAVFKECKQPKRKPDYISYTKDNKISSLYWYGKNKRGSYIIRTSNHWSTYKNIITKETKKGCGYIGKTNCFWYLKMISKIILDKQYTGKVYLKNFKHLN